MKLKTRRRLAWLLGFSITFDVYLVARHGNSFRPTDVLGVLLMLWLPSALVLDRRRNTGVAIRLGLAGALAIPWLLSEIHVVGVTGSGIALRWMLAIPLAYLLWRVAHDPATRRALWLGLAWGAAASVGVLLVQHLHHIPLTQRLHLALQGVGAFRQGTHLRPPGMYGHPNASAAVASLAIPAVLGLIDERLLSARWAVFGFLVAFAATAMTLTRSTAGVCLVVLALWMLRSGVPLDRRIRRLAIGIGLLAAILILGPPGGAFRWTHQGLSTNAQARILTTTTSFHLALTHPFGFGATYGNEIAPSTGGFLVAHDAFLQLALLAGLALAALVFALMVARAARLFFESKPENWLALQLIGLFLFEDHFSNPVFIVLTVWLLAEPLLARRTARRMEGPAPPRSQARPAMAAAGVAV
jgi:hypothetical protein